MPTRLRSRVYEESDEHESISMPDSNALSMVSRVQERVEELRRMFELPPEEMFMDEFYCALHKKILLQGRMYVFENYVCFYSNLFGWVKQKAIPLQEVSEVSKKRNYGFPNSIQIAWKGKKEFFTSFLSRDDAFTLIANAWNQTKLGKPDHILPDGRAVSEPSFPTELSTEEEPPSDSPSALNGLTAHQRSCSDNASRFYHPREAPQSTQDPNNVDHDTESDPDDEDADSWVLQAGQVPDIPKSMSLLWEADFNVPVREFFQKILSSEAIFLEEYHRDRGDQRFRLSQWQRHSGLEGVVRHATFMSPVKTPGGFRLGLISPKVTECNENQRYRVYEGTTLVFETSQVMKDIPYGDNFKVDTRWNISSTPNGCHVGVYGSVPFVRHVISPIRMMIESSVMKEVRESMSTLFSLLSDTLIESTSPSLPEPSRDERKWSGRLSDNLDNILGHEDLRAKLVNLLREGLGDSDVQKGSVSSGEPPAHQESQSAQKSARRSFPWTERVVSCVPLRSSNVIIIVGLAVVLLVQLISMLFWVYPPHSQYRQYPPVYMPTNRMYLHQSLTYMSQDLETLHERLEVVASSIGRAMDEIREAKIYEKSEL